MTTAPVELAYECFGEGRPVVILHGLFGSKRNWRSQAQKLAGHYRVYTVDLRNHGDSPHSAEMNYTAMSADIEHWLATRGLADVELIGHSMGGKAAMTYALAGGDRIRRLTIVDIAPRAYANDYGDILVGLTGLDLTAITRRAEADRALAGAIPETGIRQFILQNLRIDQGRPRWRCNLDALDRHIDDLVGAVPAPAGAVFNRPVCCIRGVRSDRVTEADREAMAALFPDFALVTIPDAGHWPHAENPAAFERELHAVLATG